MAKITSYNFGFIVVDGKQYLYDVVIHPDGIVSERQPGKGRLGSHKITVEELERLQGMRPDIILIGTGASGLAKLDDDAQSYAQQPESNVKLLPSVRAAQKFNQLVDEGKRVAALFHITC